MFIIYNNKELANPDSPHLPKTQTDINVQFSYKKIARFISQKKKKTVTIKSPDDLHKPYKKHFNVLCKLAFDLLGNKMVVLMMMVCKTIFLKRVSQSGAH